MWKYIAIVFFVVITVSISIWLLVSVRVNDHNRANEVQKTDTLDEFYNNNDFPDVREVQNDQIAECQVDSDCVLQETSCNRCSCPTAVSKDTYKPLDCSQFIPDSPICNVVCLKSDAVCEQNRCVIKKM